MKLLNIDANAKTIKGQKLGYMTAIMYLAPYLASGKNVCPMAATAKCFEGCLNTAGRGGIAKRGALIATDAGALPDNTIQRARLARTAQYWDDRDEFMTQLVTEIRAFIKKAERKNLIPVVRLNGTSDIQWERGHPVTARNGIEGASWCSNIFEAFPGVQFYDYTKLPARFERTLPTNYHLSLSFSGANEKYAAQVVAAHDDGAPMVVVVRNEESKQAKLARTGNAPRIDGDQSDLRFTDPAGAMVILKAKGKARLDTSGFVID